MMYHNNYDGDCMFRLMVSADSNELRQRVADHLEALYHHFLCEPVSYEDGYN